MSVYGGSFLETCQHIDVEKYIFTRFEREVVCFRLVVRVNKLIKLIINIERHDVEELP